MYAAWTLLKNQTATDASIQLLPKTIAQNCTNMVVNANQPVCLQQEKLICSRHHLVNILNRNPIVPAQPRTPSRQEEN